MKKVKAFIERADNSNYSAYIDLNENGLNYGIHGTDKTTNEALADFKSAYEARKEFYQEEGKEFVEADFEYHYDI